MGQNLNNELLRLRERIGDMYTIDGEKFNSSSIETDDGTAMTKEELLAIWNTSVREFIKLMVSVIPRDRWAVLLPGYILIVSDVAAQPMLVFKSDIVRLNTVLTLPDSLNTIIQLQASTGAKYFDQKGKSIGVYFPPNKLFEVAEDISNIYKNQTMYTFSTINLGLSYEKCLLVFPLSDNNASCYNIIILKNHVDLAFTGLDLDYEDIPPQTLDVLLDLSEREYLRRRQFDQQGMSQNKINEDMQLLTGGINGIRTK